MRCQRDGWDEARGLLKAYVPIKAARASGRPFGFVFSPARKEEGPYLELAAYGGVIPGRAPVASTSGRTSACTVGIRINRPSKPCHELRISDPQSGDLRPPQRPELPAKRQSFNPLIRRSWVRAPAAASRRQQRWSTDAYLWCFLFGPEDTTRVTVVWES